MLKLAWFSFFLVVFLGITLSIPLTPFDEPEQFDLPIYEYRSKNTNAQDR